ncbi:MAG TPA: CRTAC1 family protein [Actinomycetota bacterium]|nr:CRTAC1 family protein [Actinomycetota bacterium]
MTRADRGDDRRTSTAVWLVAGVAGGALAALVGWLAFEAFSDDPAAAMEPPTFVEEASAAGIDHVYDGDFTYFVGGGVAAFDCDDDGRPDLYFAGGSNPAALYRNRSPVGGALRFVPVADPATDLTEVVGAYPVDIDGDGPTDLAVLRFGENVLLRGLGDCRFERANEAWNVDGGNAWTTAFSATWEGDASLPTLAFGNYLDPTQTERATCADNELVRPEDGTSTYADPIPLSPGWCTLSILFSDWSASGRADLRMTNDRHYYVDGEEQLWRIADGSPDLYTAEEGWQHMEIWGMGIASYDVTGDGLPEVYLTSQADNKLQTLTAGSARPNYRDIALRRGVIAHKPYTGGDTLPSTAWHPEFQDVNNDGFIDLFVSKGNVEAQVDYASKDPSNLLLGRPNGTFVERAPAAGIVSFVRGRGAALVDLNLDGMLDLVQVNRRENVSVWRNVGWGDAADPQPMGNWISLRFEQPGPNRDAIGSWVEVRFDDRTAEREVTVGGGHAGGQLGWIHFGLGEADGAEVRVRWPDGDVSPWLRFEADTWAIIGRGATEPRLWAPGD